MKIEDKLLKLRKEKGLSQEEVADRLNVSRQTISKWETGQSSPDFDKIIPICELYEISSDELKSTVHQMYESAKQDYLNSYEEACSKYIDNKVDQNRFYKTYSTEIKNIVEKDPYKSVFDSFSSVYTAIKKVYEKWKC